MKEIGFPVEKPIRLQLDSQQSIFMAQDVASHQRTGHIQIKELMLTFHTRNGDFEPQYLRSEDNPADMMTKPLGKVKFEKHRATCMGKPNNNQYELSRHIFTPSKRAAIMKESQVVK
jgi:hypothetical protein